MRVALITACYGAYDPVRPIPDMGFDDAILVSDVPVDVAGWRTVVEPSDDYPRLAAKRPKMLPWNYTDCDAAVWLDASFEVVNPAFGEWSREHLKTNDFVVWLHPEGRVDIRQEVEVCWFFDKYKDYPLREQLAAYVADGMPELWGLFACGTLGWVFTEEAKRLGRYWYAENVNWSIQDQVSLPYLLWREGKRFGIWQANEYQNEYLRLRWDERPRPQD